MILVFKFEIKPTQKMIYKLIYLGKYVRFLTLTVSKD